MKNVFKWSGTILFGVITCTPTNADQSAVNEQNATASMTLEARDKLKTFAQTLKATLVSTIKTSGFEAGVQVCHKAAPEIAKQLSTDSWELSRISLKPRNIENKPVSWEQTVLLEFEKRYASGEPISDLEYISAGPTQFTMVKAIPTDKICLACHGKKIEPSIKVVIDERYPADLATGFSEGDIRGAFIVEKMLQTKK